VNFGVNSCASTRDVHRPGNTRTVVMRCPFRNKTGRSCVPYFKKPSKLRRELRVKLQGLISGLRIDCRFMIDLRMIKILLLTIAVLEGYFLDRW
jgi:hypothetical protein